MIEILGALAIAAFVIGGGIVLFNTATNRAEGANIAQSLQGFMVDMNQYLAQNHRETWTVAGAIVQEADLQTVGTNGLQSRAFGAGPGGVAPAPILAGNWAGTADTENLNLLRFANLPSIRRFESESSNDPDGAVEWSLYVNEDTTYDIAFSIMPLELISSGTEAVGAIGGSGGTRLMHGVGTPPTPVDIETIHQITGTTGCPAAADTSEPDTAVAVAIALENIDVCEQVANRISRFSHVIESWCLDEDTVPPTFAAVSAPDGGNDTQGDASLHICFGVQ